MILVDMSHLLMRNLFMNLKDIYNKDTNEYNGGYLAHVVVQNVLSFARDFGASKENPCVICVDAKPSWRHDYYEENCTKFGEYDGMTYKGHRVKDDSIPWDDIYATFESVLNGLAENTDFIVMNVEKAEGDDIIAVLARYNEFVNKTVSYVISSDKDFKQLQTEKIWIYDPIKKLILPEIDREQEIKVKCIAGDKGDNILAIKKQVGEKTALKMVAELDDILKTNADMRAKYEFNSNLINFDFIPSWLQKDIVMKYKEQHFNYNATGVLKFCSEHRLQKLATRVGEFKFKDGWISTKLNTPAKGAIERADATIEAFFG